MAKVHMNKKKDSADFSYEIHKEFGFLNDKHNKIVAKISWNDKDPKYDIRACYEKDGEIKLGKGISLSRDEVMELRDILDDVLEEDDDSEDDDDEEDDDKSPPIPPKKKPVDFSEIFGQAEGIVEKREAGFTTKDGFILLKRRPGVKI